MKTKNKLFNAVKRNDVEEILKLVLFNSADVNVQNPDGLTPLHPAVASFLKEALENEDRQHANTENS